jgi:hypothetical protein
MCYRLGSLLTEYDVTTYISIDIDLGGIYASGHEFRAREQSDFKLRTK